MYQLTAKTGAAKGGSWVVNEIPLVIGRDITCDITVNDPTVSRRHCEVLLAGGDVVLSDLGSSNATFVNANPVKRTVLQVGDEVAVGGAIFIMTQVRHAGTVSTAKGDSRSATCSLKIGEPTYLDEDSESLFSRARPRTAEDFSALFTLGRELSQCTEALHLVKILMKRLMDRFSPQTYWLVRYGGPDEALEVYPREDDAALTSNEVLHEIVWRAIREMKGVLLPERWSNEGKMGIRTTMVAPIALAKEPVGAMVLQVDTPKRIYDENDLEFFLTIAHTVAPYLRAVERLEQLERENARLLSGTPHSGPIIGGCRAIGHVRALARSCARSDLNVLIMGETGTGKELVARMIHDLSERHARVLTVVNCAAIPDELFESEVFGHERGAFTGAHMAKVGLFEESDRGTLFLDEVGDLSLHNQARLLRAIETGTFRRLGGNTDIQVEVRVLSATNKDLSVEVAEGRFRRDLYHRLNTFEVRIPPLRERRSDIPVLIDHFLEAAQARFRRPVTGFSPEALQMLQARHWPGNVRELRNVIERAVVVARHPQILPSDFVEESVINIKSARFLSMAEMEREHIAKALEECGGNIKATADLLKIGRSTLYRKISEYGLVSC